jgi:DNA-binding beta-propeller fold protein YncE
MKKSVVFALASAAVCTATPLAASELVEKEISVPGFADFLVVDGDTVWVTNDGRVEQWSTTGKLASVEMPRPCGTMALASGSVWVANCNGGEVYRISPEEAKVLATIPAGLGPSGELNVVAGAGYIWAPNETAGTVSKIDPATNTVVATVAVAPGTSYLAYGFDALWAASGKNETLQRVDPQTDAVTHTIKLGKTPGFLAAGEGAVWIQEQGDGTVARIDPATATVTGRVKVGDNLKWGDIDTGAGKVWLRTTDDQMFAVIDPQSMEVVARAGKPSGSGAIRYTPRGVWTSAHDLHSLSWWTEPTETGE